jgi:hypothetical protein
MKFSGRLNPPMRDVTTGIDAAKNPPLRSKHARAR